MNKRFYIIGGALTSEHFNDNSEILSSLKNFRTKSTIFEINRTQSTQNNAVIMRNKRRKDNSIINKYEKNYNSSSSVKNSINNDTNQNLCSVDDSLHHKGI